MNSEIKVNLNISLHEVKMGQVYSNEWSEKKMSRRVDNEGAYCAEEFDEHHAIMGDDYKVYCSQRCETQGELLSAYEAAQSYLPQSALAA